MKIAKPFNFGSPISCHAWNKYYNQIALSFSDNLIHIFLWSNNFWQHNNILNDHELRVTSIDWSPTCSDTLVSCSEDRNAFVWKNLCGKWTATMVILRFDRAALCLKWSPLGNKFAVGGFGKIGICYYDAVNNWWLSKHIKKVCNGGIQCVDWHPNNAVIAVGSTSFSLKMFSAHHEEFDSGVSGASQFSEWGVSSNFGNLLKEYYDKESGWILNTAFSPCGKFIVWVSFVNTISLVSCKNSDEVIKIRTLYHLPFTSVHWITPQNFVCAGHNGYLCIYAVTAKSIKFVTVLEGKEACDEIEEEKSYVASARNKFRSLDMNAQEMISRQISSILHNGVIREIRGLREDSLNPCALATSKTSFSTVSVDGQLVVWNLTDQLKIKHNITFSF